MKKLSHIAPWAARAVQAAWAAGAIRAACTSLAALIVAAGCTPADKFLRVDTPEITIAADHSGRIDVTVSASTSWMFDPPAVGTREWLSLEYSTTDPALLRVSAARNESLDERTAEINIVSGDGLSIVVPVVQLAMDARLDVSPRRLDLAATDTLPHTIAVTTTNLSAGWRALQLRGDWLSLVSERDGTLTVKANPLRSMAERMDTVVLLPVSEAFLSLADSIVVVQTGLGLLVESEAMNLESFEIEAPATGGDFALRVFSTAPWRVTVGSSNPDGTPTEALAIDLTEGAADTGNGTVIVMTVAENISTDERTFTLSFESGGETYQYICRQQGRTPEDQDEQQTPETPAQNP
ncbi:MAG: hypothetical protein LBU97_05260 [Alistipes sp.]|jgi:hypothetical protein|nr:hypothetical protein [Alistipes sp.]